MICNFVMSCSLSGQHVFCWRWFVASVWGRGCVCTSNLWFGHQKQLKAGRPQFNRALCAHVSLCTILPFICTWVWVRVHQIIAPFLLYNCFLFDIVGQTFWVWYLFVQQVHILSFDTVPSTKSIKSIKCTGDFHFIIRLLCCLHSCTWLQVKGQRWDEVYCW